MSTPGPAHSAAPTSPSPTNLDNLRTVFITRYKNTLFALARPLHEDAAAVDLDNCSSHIRIGHHGEHQGRNVIGRANASHRKTRRYGSEDGLTLGLRHSGHGVGVTDQPGRDDVDA